CYRLWTFLGSFSGLYRIGHGILQQAPMTDVKPPSGRTIVLELQREMEARLYPLMYRTLAPGVYHVYLHPDDYSHVQPVAAAVVTGPRYRPPLVHRRRRASCLCHSQGSRLDRPRWERALGRRAGGELHPRLTGALPDPTQLGWTILSAGCEHLGDVGGRPA